LLEATSGLLVPRKSVRDINFITDAWLLDDYSPRASRDGWSDEQKRQVTGFLQLRHCAQLEIGAHRIDPKPATNELHLGSPLEALRPATIRWRRGLPRC